MARVAVLFACLLFLPGLVRAQAAPIAGRDGPFFVQIEAQPSLAEAQARARDHARNLPDVNGFALPSGWYAIALGPYDENDAVRVLAVYRREGVIARDSYIARGSDYGQQFWPVGANVPARTTPAPMAQPDAAPTPTPDETLREARASEALLGRDERAALQVALEWAGVYRGAIDAAFGPGTRAAMAAWQRRNGHEPTGVLTSRQRATLLRQHDAVLDGLGLETVRDAQAGIEIRLPLGVVAFDRHEAPFAHYTASGDLPAQVLLISQPGDRATMTALYDLLQTLEIIPETGERRLERDGFTLTGAGREIVSTGRAWLEDGEIKGFILVWPAGDEERRTRLLAEMEQSFARLPGTLDALVAPVSARRMDLVSGLELRRPKLSRSGFYVDEHGAVLTAAEAVAGCERITLDETHGATVAHLDRGLGIAILRPHEALAPVAVARFQQDAPRLLSRVAVAGYSYEGRLGAPSVTFGQIAELSGLAGESHLRRLALAAMPGDLGGPVVDAGGAVLGMLVPGAPEGRSLPEGVSFAAGNGALQEVLAQGGVTARVTREGGDLSAEALSERASAMTVLVSCWE
ncbi:MAG: trypsin-like peptidase domain-containing protein [Roseovarius sp.]|nr:trypsin-like peptidase domain-containing protein [Roseovarius sp.]